MFEMRRIISKEKEEKRNKRNQWILVTLLVVILLGSTFGIIVNSFGDSGNSNNKIKYNGVEFVNSNGFWVTEFNGVNLGFTYNPAETENLSVNMDFSDSIYLYSNVPVYIYSENSDAEAEIYRNLYNIAERIQKACPEGKNCTGDVPAKDCTNKFIIIEESDTEEITQNNQCIFIRAKEENLVKAGDEFLYKIFGMK